MYRKCQESLFPSIHLSVQLVKGKKLPPRLTSPNQVAHEAIEQTSKTIKGASRFPGHAEGLNVTEHGQRLFSPEELTVTQINDIDSRHPV